MTDAGLRAAWERTREHQERARTTLGHTAGALPVEYDHYLEHDEFGLALDIRVMAADQQRAGSAVWLELAAAAREMAFDAHDAVHGSSARTIAARLAAAKEWRELRALLNEWDPIGVYDPQSAFPTDEYDCLYGR